jgi:hypothetical protein
MTYPATPIAGHPRHLANHLLLLGVREDALDELDLNKWHGQLSALSRDFPDESLISGSRVAIGVVSVAMVTAFTAIAAMIGRDRHLSMRRGNPRHVSRDDFSSGSALDGASWGQARLYLQARSAVERERETATVERGCSPPWPA